MNSSRSIKNPMMVIITVLSVISIAISCFILNSVIERHDREMIKVLAASAYEDINNELLKPIMVARTIASDSFLKQRLKEEGTIPREEQAAQISAYLDTLCENLGYSAAYIVSSSSRNYYSRSGFIKRIDLEDEQDAWYAKFLDMGVEYEFDAGMDEADHHIWKIFVDTRITDENGGLLGVCGVGVRMAELQKLLRRCEVENHIRISFIDRDGMAQLDTDQPDMEWETLRAFLAEQNANQFTMRRVGESYIIARYIPDFHWHLVIQRAADAAGSALSDMILYMLAGYFLSMIALLAFIRYGLDRERQEAKKSGIASHSGLYVTMHLLDLTSSSIHELSRNSGVKLFKPGNGRLDQTRLDEAVRAMTSPESVSEMLAFTELATLPQRLADGGPLRREFLSAQYGWCRASFIVVDADETGKVRQAVFALEIIDEEKRREEHLRILSETDAMTGLRNRGSGEGEIRTLMDMGLSGMFCLLDADKFKSINDTYGHGVGDQVICAIAECLKKSFRASDIVMRLGGDEFACYALGVNDEKEGKLTAETLFREIDAIRIPELGERKITISLGCAFFPGSGMDFAELYRRADTATYISKKTPGNRCTFYGESEE